MNQNQNPNRKLSILNNFRFLVFINRLTIKFNDLICGKINFQIKLHRRKTVCKSNLMLNIFIKLKLNENIHSDDVRLRKYKHQFMVT